MKKRLLFTFYTLFVINYNVKLLASYEEAHMCLVIKKENLGKYFLKRENRGRGFDGENYLVNHTNVSANRFFGVSELELPRRIVV